MSSQHFTFVWFAILSSFLASTFAHQLEVHGEDFIPDAVLVVTEAVQSQPCVPDKPVILINGTSPGPELRLLEGDVYWIRVYNNMQDQNVTIHWHGLTMATSPFSDGTPGASQWPIPPMKYFDYEIGIPDGMAGTYFYHSHVHFQAVSATGPLIVEDKVVPYQYDEERIVMLQDVFNKTDEQIEHGLVASPLEWSGESMMVLVNGQGGGWKGDANKTFCNSTLSAFDVEPGKTYRFRFIGGTALTFASLVFEGHNMTFIEADAGYTQPLEISHLQIGSGQRISVLLTTKYVPEKSAYYMQIESRDRPTVTTSFAVLNYGVPSPPSVFYPPCRAPLTVPNTTLDWVDYDLAPHPANTHMARMPTADEVTRIVTITTHQRFQGRVEWVQNQLPWDETFPQEPYLVSLYRASANGSENSNFPSMERALANEGIDPVTRTFPARMGEVLEIVIQNTGGDRNGVDVHPWHGHGAHPWDLGSGRGSYNRSENERRWAQAKGSPIKRDTSMLYRDSSKADSNAPTGWRAWRLEVTQPGVWMVHCHILQHMIMGMQTVWVMGNESEVMTLPQPEVEGYLTYGGSVLGDENTYPSVVKFQSKDQWTQAQ